MGRFINADEELPGIGEPIYGNNLFVYCLNNFVNMCDQDGKWPKWLTSSLNVFCGAAQMVAGGALGVFTSWTGVGAVAAGFLIVNGAATCAQGIGQIVNDITESNVFREDNIIRTSFKDIGGAIGGETGANLAGYVYDILIFLTNLYAGKVCLEKLMPRIVNSKLFDINNGYGIQIGHTDKSSYGYINLFYQNPSFLKDYGIRGGTFISINNKLGECIFRIDWDPVKGIHIQ